MTKTAKRSTNLNHNAGQQSNKTQNNSEQNWPNKLQCSPRFRSQAGEMNHEDGLSIHSMYPPRTWTHTLAKQILSIRKKRIGTIKDELLQDTHHGAKAVAKPRSYQSHPRAQGNNGRLGWVRQRILTKNSVISSLFLHWFYEAQQNPEPKRVPTVYCTASKSTPRSPRYWIRSLL